MPHQQITKEAEMKNTNSPTSLRLPDGLLRSVTKAAHKLEMSRTTYIVTALQAAVEHDLPSVEYRHAWDSLKDIYDNLEPDIMNDGSANKDMKLKHVLETILPVLGASR